MNFVGIFIASILIFGLAQPPAYLFYCVCISHSLCSISIVDPNLIGGLSIVPSVAASICLVAKVIGSSGGRRIFIYDATNFSRLGFLWLYLLFAVLGAFLLPIYFEGSVRTVGMSSSRYDWLKPSPSNFSQSIYLVISVFCVSVSSVLMTSEKFHTTFLRGMLLCGLSITITGFVDWACSILGVSGLLSPFRTANFAILSNVELGGGHRVIGLCPEASMFGSLAASTFSFLLFSGSIYFVRGYRGLYAIVLVGTGLMSFMSRSTTAYLMLIAASVIYFFVPIYSPFDSSRTARTVGLLRKSILFLFPVLGLCVLLILKADFWSTVVELINTLLFEKTASSSFQERGQWTLYGIKTFQDTNWIGAGIGSVRTSNFFVNVLASTGIAGGLLFSIFIVQVVRLKSRNLRFSANQMRIACKACLLVLAVSLWSTATTPDFGSFCAIIVGAVAGTASRTHAVSKSLR